MLARRRLRSCRSVARPRSHDLRGGGDGEPRLCRNTAGRPAEAGDHVAQGAVVHVQAALPSDATWVDAQLVALVDVVINQRRERVVGRGDGVEVTGEVEVDVLHRHDLRVAATGRAALDPHDGAEGGLTQRDHGVVAEEREGVGKPDEHRGLALPGGGWGHAGDQDKLRLRLTRVLGHVDLGHVRAVRDERVGRNAGLRRNVRDGRELVRLRDLNVGFRGVVLGRRLRCCGV